MLFKRLFQAATICEYQSISEAARTLGISQSTLSASVAGLEQIVGNRLFERAFRGVYPLASAWSIYCQMDEIDWQLRRVESLRESHGEDTSCSPTIVLPETMAGGQLHRSLRAGVGSGMFRLIIEDNSFPRGHRLRMSVPDSISPQSSHVCDYGWSVVALAKTMDTVPGSPLDMDLLRHRSIAIAGLGDFEQQALEKMLVEDVMTRQVATLSPDDELVAAGSLFKENLFHAVPIVDEEGLLLGILTTYDLLEFFFNQPALLTQ